jgi:hypothetical protein
LDSSLGLDEDFNNYINSHRESNANYLNQIENAQQIRNSDLTQEENNINLNTINNIPNIPLSNRDKNSNKIKPKEKNLKEDDENKEKSLFFLFPKTNTSPLTINYVKKKNQKVKY